MSLDSREGRPPFDPAAPRDNAFVDALVGVDGLFREVDALVAAGSFADQERMTSGQDEPAAFWDALVGLVSLRKTLGLILDALVGKERAARPEAPTQLSWRRQELR